MQEIYEKCPKCGCTLAQPLPDSAACPVCGIYFFKWKQAHHQRDTSAHDTGDESAAITWRACSTSLLKPLAQIDEPTFYGRCLVLLLLAIWSWLLIGYDYRDGEIGASFMHNILLPIHEAGHIIFIPFGEFMTILGGSLFQLAIPWGIGITFIVVNRDNFAAAIGLWWGSVSLLDLAPYIYDSLNPQLILLGGHTGEDGAHDWIYLLSRLGQLGNAQRWGMITHTLGSILIMVALVWAVMILIQQYQQEGFFEN